jgi:hypothetical protein
VAGADQRQTKQAWKRPVCASSCHPCKLSRDSTARRDQLSGWPFTWTWPSPFRLCLLVDISTRRVQSCHVAVFQLGRPFTAPGWWNHSVAQNLRAAFSSLVQRSPLAAAQTCCAPICDVGPLSASRGDISLRLLCRPSHAESSRFSRFTCSLQLHCFWTFSCHCR